jgi:hypothetical protein
MRGSIKQEESGRDLFNDIWICLCQLQRSRLRTNSEIAGSNLNQSKDVYVCITPYHLIRCDEYPLP